MKRYPIEPLANLLGAAPGTVLHRLGVSGTTAKDYRTRGVSERVADRLATKAGYHPAIVWPDWADDAIRETQEECAADDCDATFFPTDARQRFCSHRCVSRIHARKKREDAAVRARQAEQRRRYYQEAKSYEKRREQARYWSDPERWRAARRRRYQRDAQVGRGVVDADLTNEGDAA